jgi:tetratricopeptide (TPR) repeat protein
MISPSHLRPQFDPAALFTNRERAKAQFVAALEGARTTDQYRVLNWFGVGGQGKTALLEEFERTLHVRSKLARDLSARPPGHALIDFDNPTNRAIATALLSIREKLRTTAGLHCPTFEAALLRYFMLTQPGMSIKELRAQFFTTGSEVLDDIVQALGQAGEFGGHLLPGFGLLSKYGARLTGKASHAFYRWWTQRGIRAFSDIDTLSQDALLRRLPTYLGADLMDALDDRHPPPGIVIMFDTYEALGRGHGLKDGPGTLRIDYWVRQLVQDARGVLFVIAGREKLRWSEVSPDWANIVEFHILGGLGRSDSEALLGKYEVQEPEVRARMIAGARSREFGEADSTEDNGEAYLPFYLALQAETYHDVIANGKTPRPAEFGGDHPLILARFLEHLDSETDKLLRLASYPAALDPAVLDLLAERFLGGRANADWSRIYTRSVISEEKDSTRFLHDLLSQALQEREHYERPELYRDIHRELFRWFANRCDESDPKAITEQHERSFLAALRHLSKIEVGGAVRWANPKMLQFDEAARWHALEEACAIVLPFAERAFGEEHHWTTTYLLWLALAYDSTGRYAEAQQLYERVCAIAENTQGSEHPGLAPTLTNLANLYTERGRYTEAEHLYKRVRTIYQKTLRTEHSSFATTLANLARLYIYTGRYAQAMQLYQQARAIQKKILLGLGPTNPALAATLTNLADLYRDTDRYADAAQLYKRAQATYEKTLGPENPALAATLTNLADLYRDTARYADAEQLCERARAIQEKMLGPEHPALAVTLANLAWVYGDIGRYADAEQLYKSAQAINEKTLGPEHPRFVTTLANLAWVYSETGRYADAEQLYERARAICGKTMGPEHPCFVATLRGLAQVCRETGRYANAEGLYERVRAIQGKTLGPEHPTLARTLSGLADVHRSTGRYAEAAQLYEHARAIQKKTLGRKHILFASTLRDFARLYSDTGRYAGAEQLLSQAARIYSTTLSSGDPRFARLFAVRGGLHARLLKTAEARIDFQQAATILEAAGVMPEYYWMREARDDLSRLPKESNAGR